MTEEAIISAFSDGVRDVKMKEELAMLEDLCTSLELFNLATKCARAEEGRLSLPELLAADPEEKKASTKTMGLGASKSRVQLLASWAVPRPQPHGASSSSLLPR